MQQGIEAELNRRKKLCEICSSTLLVKDIGLRLVTRTTLLSDYREWTGIDGNHHQYLTVRDLLFNLPPPRTGQVSSQFLPGVTKKSKQLYSTMALPWSFFFILPRKPKGGKGRKSQHIKRLFYIANSYTFATP